MWLTIPCYNEADRLDPLAVKCLLDDERLRVLFVDDGSKDRTLDVLRLIEKQHPGRVEVLSLASNLGKGEAVRLGMLRGLELGSRIVGYLDADFATPPKEFHRLLDVLESKKEVQVLMGTRIARLGATIERKAWRHYLGRVFATAASNVLDLVVYDTQCGAKLFRDHPAIRQALSEPFRSRWAFDVELIGRLLHSDKPLSVSEFWEEPLWEWHDRRGSKLSWASMIRTGMDVLWMGALVARFGGAAFYPSRLKNA
ncbi:MAG: glycosyltransferase [Deltaproteobacteria bacterium]|nr:glycosyltransferase [Deltaproteobacteria bacterium]